MYAGANVLSPRVAAAHTAELGTLPAMGWPGQKVQRGVEELGELERLAVAQTARALRGRFAEVRFLSATMANLAVYAAFTRPGDTIAVLPREAGAHASQLGRDGTAGVRGLRVVALPYDAERLDVDATRLAAFVRRERPRLLLVGGSVTLFPHDLAALRSAADLVGAMVVYDASQCAGLVAAGRFQDPIAEGADVVTFSTYKTLAGPAGGAAVTVSRWLAGRIAHVAYPCLTSNYDASRLGPLAVAAAEAVEQAPPWADRTLRLAFDLARCLHERGVGVLGAARGFTRSHQVVLDVRDLGGGRAACDLLAAAGVLASPCPVPTQLATEHHGGVRLGVQEIVRRGAGPEAAEPLAALVHAALDAAGGARLADLRDEVMDHLRVDIWGRTHRMTGVAVQ